MENFQILLECTSEMRTILGLVNTVLNLIRWVIPIILIVMVTMDIAKIVTTSNNDEKEVKAAQKKFTTRIIYAVIIFLIPTAIKLIFQLVTIDGMDMSLVECMENSAKK